MVTNQTLSAQLLILLMVLLVIKLIKLIKLINSLDELDTRNIYNGNKIFDSTCLALAFAKPNMICRTDKLSIFCKLFDSDICNRDTKYIQLPSP